MKELSWSQYDLVECLGAVPVYEEFFGSFTYSSRFDELTLELTVWPTENTVAICISGENSTGPFLSVAFVVGDEIQFIKEENLMSLRYLNSIMVPTNFWQAEEDEKGLVIDIARKVKTDFELTTSPHLTFRVL